MAAPGAAFPSHLQPNRRTEAHQQRLLEAQADLLAAKHPVQNGSVHAGPTAKPAGLFNEGNTCFFNSTFQALAATTSLIDLIGPVIFPAPGSDPSQSGASTSTSTSTTTAAHNIPDALDHPAKTYTTTATGSDNAPLYPHSIPSLLDAALEPENARLLPVTLAFEKCLGKAWRAKDEGLKGSISASSSSAALSSGKEAGKRESNAEKEKSVSLKALLRELGKKYDQYEDYRQQDAHELLRHLLDSMSMEEKDLIKVLHPPPKIPGSHKRTSSSRQQQQRNHAMVGEEGEGMIPFADALFGGSLVSVVICQGCKSVSHTYEGFMDISLSIGNQQPKVRKRDRIKAVASKFKLGSHKPSVPPAAPSSGSANDFNAANNVYLEGVYEPMSSSGLTDHHESTADEEGGNHHHHAAQHRVGGGRKESVTSMAVSTTSMGSDATSGPTVAGFFGNKNKRDSMDAGLKKRSSLTSWTTGKKRSSRPSTASSFDSSNEISAENFRLGTNGGNLQTSSGQKTSGISNIYPFSGFRSNETTPTSSRRNSQVGLTLDHSSVVERIEEEDQTVPPKPRPEQAAYIRRLLNGPNLPPRAMDDPLERLRTGMAQMPISPGATGSDASHLPETTPAATHQPTIEGLETDLMDSLRNFTAVEVLEGDNAFACHKCWRYKTGRGGRRRKELARLANMAQAPAAGETSSSSDSEDGAATPAKRNSVAFADPRRIPEIAVTTDDEPANPSIAIDENSVPNGSLTANRSPRPSTTSSVEADRLTVVSSASGRSNSGTSGYQTSSEDSSDEAPVGRLSVVRPPPPQRRKSQHFVLQRAFKRYMIARAPPVLVFHFKRFQQSSKQAANNMYSGSFAALKKIDDFVSFPERIDLSPFLAPNRQDYKVVIGEDGVGRAEYHSHPAGDTGPELIPMRYRLYAVVVHLGLTAISGHYVCYVLVDPGMIIKTRASESSTTEPVEAQDVTCEPDMAAVAIADPSDGTSASPHPVDNRVWCYCSDTQVRLASLEEVLKAKAYMCFYEKST